jgi:hypothetical protein
MHNSFTRAPSPPPALRLQRDSSNCPLKVATGLNATTGNFTYTPGPRAASAFFYITVLEVANATYTAYGRGTGSFEVCLWMYFCVKGRGVGGCCTLLVLENTSSHRLTCIPFLCLRPCPPPPPFRNAPTHLSSHAHTLLLQTTHTFPPHSPWAALQIIPINSIPNWLIITTSVLICVGPIILALFFVFERKAKRS